MVIVSLALNPSSLMPSINHDKTIQLFDYLKPNKSTFSLGHGMSVNRGGMVLKPFYGLIRELHTWGTLPKYTYSIHPGRGYMFMTAPIMGTMATGYWFCLEHLWLLEVASHASASLPKGSKADGARSHCPEAVSGAFKYLIHQFWLNLLFAWLPWINFVILVNDPGQ